VHFDERVNLRASRQKDSPSEAPTRLAALGGERNNGSVGVAGHRDAHVTFCPARASLCDFLETRRLMLYGDDSPACHYGSKCQIFGLK
jgi:hypothetical protein